MAENIKDRCSAYFDACIESFNVEKNRAYGESLLRALHWAVGAEEQSLSSTSIPKLINGTRQLQKLYPRQYRGRKLDPHEKFRQVLFLLGQLIPDSDAPKQPRADLIKNRSPSTYQDNWKLCLGIAGAECGGFKPCYAPTAVAELMSPDHFGFFEMHHAHLTKNKNKKYQLNMDGVDKRASFIVSFEKIIAASSEQKRLVDAFTSWICSNEGLGIMEKMREESHEAGTYFSLNCPIDSR